MFSPEFKQAFRNTKVYNFVFGIPSKIKKEIAIEDIQHDIDESAKANYIEEEAKANGLTYDEMVEELGC